ncbi:hypothetical protein [Pseudomonas phage U1B]|nr:hypothetical protein [Pseudomonas phage T2P]QYV99407.1 hypothetical protein [Pseudomonas phage U1B]QYV99863.1 hypothetical protein [Pseudomonas phage U5]
MQRNNDPQQVIMSIEMYNSLLAMANDSPHYTTKLIQRHVRKMNPFLQPAHLKNVRTKEAIRSQRIREARAFFEANHRKILYAKVDMGNCKKGDDPVYFPCISERIAKNRQLIQVRHANEVSYGRCIRLVEAKYLTTIIPDGYIQGTGPYKKYLVKENGPYDIREQEEKRKQAFSSEIAKKFEFKHDSYDMDNLKKNYYTQ